MKSRLRFFPLASILIVAALMVRLLAEINTDSQSPQAINIQTQKCGLAIAGPDWIVVNNNDDDTDEEWDFEVEPVPGEADTAKIIVKAKADKTPASVTISLVEGGDLVDYFWKGTLTIDGNVTGSEEAGRQKHTSAKSSYISFTVPAGKSATQTFYLEGIKNSSGLEDFAKIKAELYAPEITIGTTKYTAVAKIDTKELLVYQVDLDVDSENNNGYDAAGYGDGEDKIEASDKVVDGAPRPGKFVLTTPNTDQDGDYILDHGDLATAGQKFVPVRVELKTPFDPETASVTFDYLESIFSPPPVVGPPAPLANGGMRLWKNDAPSRTADDYIPSMVETPWSSLASGGAREVILYLEYVDKEVPEAAGKHSIGITAKEYEVEAPDEVNVTLIPVEFITPAGDPVNAPVDAGTTPSSIPDGANEFTFSDAASGVLTMKLKAKVSGVGSMPAAEQAKFTFEVDTIGNSTFAWDAANPGGKATASGDFLTATATFSGLPQNNTHFGLKKARIKHGSSNAGEAKFEVFFPIDASTPGRICNHPGGQMNTWNPGTHALTPGNVPNWYYYWRQLPEAQGVNLAYGGATINGAVPAITDWAYGRQIDKSLVLIGQLAYEADQPYGVGEFVSGIDWFAGALIHEGRHVWQVREFDRLVPSGTANTPWEHGWSFNQGANHNHWTQGTDGNPGEGGIDDDGDGTVDNLIATGPGELGKFNPATPAANRDQDLSFNDPVNNSFRTWPASLPLPNPMLVGGSAVESDAVNHANGNYNEHQNARRDWGNPGKNHKTIDKWND